MTIRSSWIRRLAVLALAVATGCSRSSGGEGDRVVRIASVLPLTGAAAELGGDMRRGQELAAERLNDSVKGGGRIELVFEDSKSNPAEGTRAVQSLLARGHRLFVVPLSTVGMAAKPLLIGGGALGFLDASHPDLTLPPHPLMFRHSQTASQEARLLIPTAARVPNATRIIVFYLNDEYGRSFWETVKSLGSSLEVAEAPFEATTDVRSVVQRTGLAQGSGVVPVVVGVGRPMGSMIQTMREQGYTGPIFASIGYVATGARAMAGDARGEIVYTDLGWTSNEATTWMTAQYRSRHGRDAPAAAVIEFQTVMLLGEAARRSGSNEPAEIAQEVVLLAPEIIGTRSTPANDILPQVVLRREGSNDAP